MRWLLLALLLAPLCCAGAFTVTKYQARDTGSESLPSMDVIINVDCDNGIVQATALDATGGQPVGNHSSYLFYVDYGGQRLMHSNRSGDSGVVVHPLSGNVKYLTGMFLLRKEAGGYRTREIQFYIEECRGKESPSPPAATKPAANTSTPAPPEPVAGAACSSDSQCIGTEACGVALGKCMPVNGTCGYAAGHLWYTYECCRDFDCHSLTKYCDLAEHMCKAKANSTANGGTGSSNASASGTGTAANTTNTTNDTGAITTGGTGSSKGGPCPFAILMVLAVGFGAFFMRKSR